MLVLSRRVGEEIVIDGRITITLIAITGDRVRLGVEAPDSVRVDRLEVHVRRATSQAQKENYLPSETPL
jgi:carbon storage regulator